MALSDEQMEDMRARLRADIRTTLRRNGLDVAEDMWVDILVAELLEDSMFYIAKVIDDGQ